jgi:hypothetical protein
VQEGSSCLESTVSAARIAASDEHHTTQRGTRSQPCPDKGTPTGMRTSLGRDVKHAMHTRADAHTKAHARTQAHTRTFTHTCTRTHARTLTNSRNNTCLCAPLPNASSSTCKFAFGSDRIVARPTGPGLPRPRRVRYSRGTPHYLWQLLCAAAMIGISIANSAMIGNSIANCRG